MILAALRQEFFGEHLTQRRKSAGAQRKITFASLPLCRSALKILLIAKMEDEMHENEISEVILDAAIEVHRTLGGPGLLEGVYQKALAHELVARGLAIQKEVIVPIIYKGIDLGEPLRLDLLVGGKVIVECKAVREYHPLFEAQLLTYLRLTNLKLGLIINFGGKLVKDGIHRVVNGLLDDNRWHRK